MATKNIVQRPSIDAKIRSDKSRTKKVPTLSTPALFTNQETLNDKYTGPNDATQQDIYGIRPGKKTGSFNNLHLLALSASAPSKLSDHSRTIMYSGRGYHTPNWSVSSSSEASRLPVSDVDWEKWWQGCEDEMEAHRQARCEIFEMSSSPPAAGYCPFAYEYDTSRTVAIQRWLIDIPAYDPEPLELSPPSPSMPAAHQRAYTLALLEGRAVPDPDETPLYAEWLPKHLEKLAQTRRRLGLSDDLDGIVAPASGPVLPPPPPGPPPPLPARSNVFTKTVVPSLRQRRERQEREDSMLRWHRDAALARLRGRPEPPRPH